MGGWPFRDWLIDRLVGTDHATRRLADEDVDDYAATLGVQPDVLLEARVKARLLQAEGKQRDMHRAGSDRHFYRIFEMRVPAPPRLMREWLALCDERDADPIVYASSLVHYYLCGTREPLPEYVLERWWVYRGRKYVALEDKGEVLACRMTNGAYRALKIRSIRLGTTRRAIVRALVCEALEGMHMGVPLVTPNGMFDDEERYNLGGALPRLPGS